MLQRPSVRLFVDVQLTSDSAVLISEPDAHYLFSVMRKRVGDCVRLFNGHDGEWEGTLTALTRRKAEVAVLHQTRRQTPEPDLWLVFSPIKRTAIDFVAIKATELGASRLVPVVTERTVVRRVSLHRLRANAKEAAEQCERLTVPIIEEPVPLDELMARWPQDRLLIFCDETRHAPGLVDMLRAQDRKPNHNSWGILVGPEGGFADTEQQLLRALPFTVTASLGPNLLRADTAAFAALALWQATVGSWT